MVWSVSTGRSFLFLDVHEMENHAFLNAAFNFCLGCEIYLRGARVLAKIRS